MKQLKGMVLRQLRSLNFIVGFAFGFISFVCIYYLFIRSSDSTLKEAWRLKTTDSSLTPISRVSPVIFIGGWPRSGTTLMRVLVHVHSQVNCGPETRVVPRLLLLHNRWKKSPVESKRLTENGLYPNGLNAAAAAYIIESIRHTTEPASVYCIKDPLNLKYMPDLKDIFPNSKFILMVRDGRAVVHSLIKRNVSIAGINWRDPFKSIKAWEKTTTQMMEDCAYLGRERCMMVKYENLIMQTAYWLRKIMNFLNLEWEENLLHHWEVIDQNKESIKISKMEKSSTQVINPINLNALTSWVTDNVFTQDVKMKLHLNVPLLQRLGYDVSQLPPDYGQPDPWVVSLTKKMSPASN